MTAYSFGDVVLVPFTVIRIFREKGALGEEKRLQTQAPKETTVLIALIL